MTSYEQLNTLRGKLEVALLRIPLGGAGQVVSYHKDITTQFAPNGTFVLNIHTFSPDQTEKTGGAAWDNLPDALKEELAGQGIGFAVRQI